MHDEVHNKNEFSSVRELGRFSFSQQFQGLVLLFREKKKLVGLGLEALYFFTLVFYWFSNVTSPLSVAKQMGHIAT